MVNLFLASVFDTFIQHSSIKDKSKQKQPEEKKEETNMNFFLNLGNLQKNSSSPASVTKKAARSAKKDMKISTIPLNHKFTISPGSPTNASLANFKRFFLQFYENDWVRRMISFLIILDVLVLCLDDQTRSYSSMILLHKLDFFLFCCFLMEVTTKLLAIGIKAAGKSLIFIVDMVIIYANLIVIIYELANNYDIFERYSKVGIGIRTLKMIRIFRVLYYTQMFSSLSILMRALFRTINKMKNFYLIMASMLIVISLMAMELLSNRARFIETSHGVVFDL